MPDVDERPSCQSRAADDEGDDKDAASDQEREADENQERRAPNVTVNRTRMGSLVLFGTRSRTVGLWFLRRTCRRPTPRGSFAQPAVKWARQCSPLDEIAAALKCPYCLGAVAGSLLRDAKAISSDGHVQV